MTEEIGAALAVKDGWHVVVYRSTMVPGTCEGVLIPLLEAGIRQARRGRLRSVRESRSSFARASSVRDFLDPPKTVVGETDRRSGEMVMELYEGLPGPRFCVPIGIAEMTKYVDNSFHALKVGFANEIGAICSSFGLDSHAVMDIFLADTKLNISPAYLRPGFAFGGSCLPKDVRALTHAARRNDIDVPLLGNLLDVQRGPSAPCGRPGGRRAVDARWEYSGCRSSRAPTTCARVRWWNSPNGSSARDSTSRSTTPTLRCHD